MKIAKLFVPGNYEDAFLYKGWLLAVSVERTVDVFDLRRMVDDLQRQTTLDTSFLPMLFLQNDWFHGSQFKTFMSNEVVFSTLCSFYDSLPSPIEVEHPEHYLHEKDEFPIETRSILDVNIYKDRLYLGIDKGCFQRDLHWTGKGVTPKSAFEQTFDARCLDISAGFGSLNLSCGSEGLFTSTDVFNWDERINPQHDVRQIASESLRSSWMHHDLVNYAGPSIPQFLSGERTGESSRSIIQLREQLVPLNDLLSEATLERGIRDEDIQFSFNSNKLMFVHSFDGHFFAIEVKRRGGMLRPRITETFKGSQTHILSAETFRSGTAIETDERVFLFRNGNWDSLLEDEVISLRTFPDQRQFQDVVLTVTEEGIMLINVFDEEPHQRRLRRRSMEG